MRAKYQWITTSQEGLVRYLVANILPHGYRFYVAGQIKPTRDVNEFDRVMERKFGYNISRSQRNRRKNACGPDGQRLGLANVHYLRYERFYILLATVGRHAFFDAHTKVVEDRKGNIIERKTFFRDARRDPILFAGYSIRIAQGGYLPKAKWRDPNTPEFDSKERVRVRIARDEFLTLQADLLERCKSTRWSAGELEAMVWSLPYLCYRPVREQLWGLVRRMNETRKQRGFKDRLEPSRCIGRKIPAIRAFGTTLGGSVD